MIRKIKSFLFVIFALIIAVSFAGCGEYIYGTNTPSSSTPSGNTGGNRPNPNPGEDLEDPPVKPNPNPNPNDDDDDDDDVIRVFTVTLEKDGVKYTNTNGIKAQWVNRYGVYSAEFINGVATIEGLDGEYHVTLSALPKETGREYTYDCNGYMANNTKPDITIELLEILYASGGLNGWTELKKLGTYRATIRTKSQEILYYYYPDDPGWYTITSWVDTTENKINPKVNIYNGNANSGFKVLDQTKDSGGSAGTYTKNFRFEVKLNWDEIGNNQIFGVMADSATYPVTVDFTVKYEGEYIRQDFGDPIYAEGPFYTGAKPSGTFYYAYKDNYKGLDKFRNPTYSLDETDVKLKETGEGAGYYHLYDEEKYASNGGWGPVLYAKLTQDTEVFWTIDPSGSHVDGGFNWNWIGMDGGMVSCIIGAYDYAYMISNSRDDNGVQHYGYAQYCNGDGAHPVTEEIKNFLQNYAVREWLFDDGEGTAENSDLNTILNDSGTAVLKAGLCLQASEDNQWLFACGYYR